MQITVLVLHYLVKRVKGAGVRGTGSADPQQMIIFWVLLIFCTAYVGFILKHLLFVHATEYGVVNAGG